MTSLHVRVWIGLLALFTYGLYPSVGEAQTEARQTKAVAPGGGIQWFATLEPALDLAQRTGRPILFLSALPSCGGVSGLW